MIYLLSLALLFGGCSNAFNPAKPHDEEPSIEKAQIYIQTKDYNSAVKVLELFRSEHPLSLKIPFVEKLLIECYSQTYDYPMLQAATDRFLYEHHEDPDRDYISFLRFNSISHQANGYPYAWMPIDRAQRDISRVKDAFIAGKTFIRDFPKSAYSPNVAHALPPLKETIARHYFLRGEMLSYRNEPIGAIRAYQYILSDLQDTSYALQAEKALEKFSKGYTLRENITFEKKFEKENG